MPIDADILDKLIVEPGHDASLRKREPGWRHEAFDDLSKSQAKEAAEDQLREYIDELADAQELLWADNTYALLIVFQALDAAGKDGTIKHVMSGINPQGCAVHSFKQPSPEELDHDFLWRAARALPERGQIGIFNRSYYEEVLVVRVHPEFLEHQQLPPGKRGSEFWKQRFADINAFERHLDHSGTKIVKFFLHVSKEEQRQRFLARLTEPGKEWKFSANDIAERAHWDDYMDAFEDAITATSTSWAPWYVIPADHKYVTRTLVAGIVSHAIRSLDLVYPEVSDEQRAANDAARRELEHEQH